MGKYCEGPLDCKIALIGEAPGAYEELEQRPFMGPSGKLLNESMQKVGILRQACYLDNVFTFRPEGNNIEPFISFTRDKVKETQIFKDNRTMLKARLNSVKANIFVAIGNVALYTLTGKWGITNYRGSIMESSLLGGKKVIPTIHPSAIMRGAWINQILLNNDLRRAVKQSFFPELKLKKRDLIIEPLYEQVLDYLARCNKAPHVSFDIEVEIASGEVSHISFALSGDSSICIPFKTVGSDPNFYTPPQELTLWKRITTVLENPSVVKIGQNLSFDSTFLFRKFGIRVRPMEDTMIAQAIVLPDFPKALDFIQSLYCDGEPYYKDDGKEWFKSPIGGELIFRRYNAMDSAIVAEAFPLLMEDLKRTSNVEAYDRQKRLVEPLVFISERGIRMNVAGMKEESLKCEERIKELKDELNLLVGYNINTESPLQIKKLFYEKKGLRPYTKMGKETVDERALQRLSSRGHREAAIMLELRHLSKLNGTYYNMSLDADGRLRCSYNPVGTKSGRISSSKTIFRTGGNLQNQPPEMKALMLADPGFLLISQDLAQAENRVVAYIAPEPRMIEAFTQGKDLHKQTASLIYGVPEEDITEDQRFWGKKANHGLNYDLGFRNFALIYQIPEHEAKFIVDKYHLVYPGVRQMHNWIQTELTRGRMLTNCYGRKRFFLDVWGAELFKEAYSFIPQSTVAEKMNQDGVCFIYYNKELFNRVELLNTVHDSIIYQVPLDAGIPAIARIILAVKENLESPLAWKNRSFNIPCDTAFGFSLDKKKMVEVKASQVQGQSSIEEALRRFLNGSDA